MPFRTGASSMFAAFSWMPTIECALPSHAISFSRKNTWSESKSHATAMESIYPLSATYPGSIPFPYRS